VETDVVVDVDNPEYTGLVERLFRLLGYSPVKVVTGSGKTHYWILFEDVKRSVLAQKPGFRSVGELLSETGKYVEMLVKMFRMGDDVEVHVGGRNVTPPYALHRKTGRPYVLVDPVSRGVINLRRLEDATKDLVLPPDRTEIYVVRGKLRPRGPPECVKRLLEKGFTSKGFRNNVLWRLIVLTFRYGWNIKLEDLVEMDRKSTAPFGEKRIEYYWRYYGSRYQKYRVGLKPLIDELRRHGYC